MEKGWQWRGMMLLAMIIVITGSVRAAGHRTPIVSGYGAKGSYEIRSERFPSPLFEREDVQVFQPTRPEGAPGKIPVIFFVPGYTNNDPEDYRGLITHMVSRGYAVVFTPYQVVSGDLTFNEKRYDTIWAGMRAAAERYGASFDLERVGYVGHSYGGAAILAMALRGYQREAWGTKSLLLFSMAPWYYFQVKTRDFVNFPAHAKLVVQVYDDDKVNDHRIARDIFERINLPSSEKDFMIVRSDRYGEARLEAGHGSPGSREGEDAIDFYAIYRTFDGLADYAFAGEEAGKRVALGNGSLEQRFMGSWATGQPIRELLAGDCLVLTRPTLSFIFPFLGGGLKGLTNVSSASQRPTLFAPESLVSAWGTNLAQYPMASETGPVAELNGTMVKVRDGACVERIAPILFVSPTQVDYLVPADMADGRGTVTIYNADGGMAAAAVTIGRVAPALFTANGRGEGVAAMTVLRIGAAGESRYENPLEYDFGQGGYVARPITPARPGEEVFLVLFGTGLRHRSRLENVTATIGGVAAEVLYAGPQGSWEGVDQVNLRLPAALAGRGLVEVRLMVDQRPANPVRINLG